MEIKDNFIPESLLQMLNHYASNGFHFQKKIMEGWLQLDLAMD